MKTVLLVLITVSAMMLQAQDIEAIIYEAYASGKKEVTIAPGTYRLKPPSTHGNVHVQLSNMTDFTVNAAGVTIVCTEVSTSFSLRNCTNVTVRGLTVDYDPLPFTQGEVTDIDKDDKWFDLALHEGYPLPPEGSAGLYVYDRTTRHWKKNMMTSGTSASLKLNGRTVHGTTDGVNARLGIEKGDLIVIKCRQKAAHVTILGNSFNCTLDGVTLFTGPTFAVLDYNGGGNRYLNCRITPGPVPPGAAEARLKANTADGIHVISSMPGPRIENCLIEGHSDDGIAIHGHYAMVMTGEGDRIVVSPKGDTLPFTTNSTVRLTRASDGTVYAEANVLSIAPVSGADKSRCEAIKSGIRIDNKNIAASIKNYYDVILDRSVSVTSGDGIDCPAKNGDGFIVRGNTIRNHRARGILIKASDGIIENNVIDGSSIAGIIIAPELGYWMEAGNSWNVVIRSNTIRNCGYERASTDSSQAGMISVIANGANGYAAPGSQRNIDIVGNTVEKCFGVNLVIAAASNVTVNGNIFRDTHSAEWRRGEGRGVDTKAVVWLDRVSDVSFSGNKLERMGPFGDTFIGASEDVSGVSGADIKHKKRILASKGFSGEAGRNDWRYLSWDGSSYSAMTYNASKNMWEGGEQYCHVYAGAQHPGNKTDSVRSWTSSGTATLRITGRPSSSGSDGVVCRIMKNTETIWTSPVKNRAGVPHEVTVRVGTGDVLFFIVNCGQNNSGDYTSWDPIIEVGQ
ncbi:MAG: right-handed parallel beta-helix repeat-containing protein [Spirochaetes bacterium]|nr:right-handed parallel beta-helix repeat-containing protein [Spirochaetota bacterium]